MIETQRLSLRPIVVDDLDAIAAVDADAREHAFGRHIARRRDTGAFVGIVGLSPTEENAPFPGTEIAWRLAFDQWGHGFATEAAGAIIRDAFGRLDIEEILAITTPANARSLAVMTRLGMTHDEAATFEHPALPAGHALRTHVVYRMRR